MKEKCHHKKTKTNKQTKTAKSNSPLLTVSKSRGADSRPKSGGGTGGQHCALPPCPTYSTFGGEAVAPVPMFRRHWEVNKVKEYTHKKGSL